MIFPIGFIFVFLLLTVQSRRFMSISEAAASTNAVVENDDSSSLTPTKDGARTPTVGDATETASVTSYMTTSRFARMTLSELDNNEDLDSEDDGSVCSGDSGVVHPRYDSCPMIDGVLAPGAGSFTFINPNTLRDVVVYYVKSPKYNKSDPVVLVLHGVFRNPDIYRDRWIDLAEEHGMFVLAPLFSNESFPGTTGYNLGNIFPTEKPKNETGLLDERFWSYHIPGVVYNFLRRTTTETTAPGYMAFGHSAGSQFLHRKIALTPDPHLLLAIAANAGWYTLPSFSINWPYGLQRTGLTEEENAASLLSTNLIVLLGDDDTNSTHSNLRHTKEADVQGPNRFMRGKYYFRMGKELAEKHGLPFNWRMEVVPGVGHDSARMSPDAALLMVAFLTKLREVTALAAAASATAVDGGEVVGEQALLNSESGADEPVSPSTLRLLALTEDFVVPPIPLATQPPAEVPGFAVVEDFTMAHFLEDVNSPPATPLQLKQQRDDEQREEPTPTPNA